MKRIRSATINGRRWRIKWAVPETIDGEVAIARCYHDKRTIVIDPSITGKTLLSAIADEVCHAHFRQLDNDYVDAFSDDVARIAFDCGLLADD